MLGVLPGIIGSLQALEAIKLVLGAGEPLIGRLLLFDALRLRFRELHCARIPQCPVCGPSPSMTELIDYEAFCGIRAPLGSRAGAHGAPAQRGARPRVVPSPSWMYGSRTSTPLSILPGRP